jgi:hypothetical protein
MMRRRRHLRFDDVEVSSMRFDHVEALSLQFHRVEVLSLPFVHGEVMSFWAPRYLREKTCLTYGRRHVLVTFIKWENGTDRPIDPSNYRQTKKGLADHYPSGATQCKIENTTVVVLVVDCLNVNAVLCSS